MAYRVRVINMISVILIEMHDNFKQIKQNFNLNK